MATTSERIKLGIFVVAAGLLLMAVIAIFAGVRLFVDRDAYVIRYPDSVSGLEEGSPVLLRGVDVGTVTDITIDPEDYELVRVTIGLEEGTVVKSDAEAVLRYKGLTGLKMVEIRGGTETAETLPPGSVIPPGEAGLAGLLDDADRLASKSEELLDNLLEMTGPENQERLATMLEAGSGLTERMDRIVTQVEGVATDIRLLIKTSVARTTDHLDDLVLSADALVDDARTALDELDLERSAEDLRATIASLRRMVDSLGSAVESREVAATIRNLAEASRNLEEFSESLRARPSRLLFDKPPKPRKLP